jgi:DNA-binding protein H-NS
MRCRGFSVFFVACVSVVVCVSLFAGAMPNEQESAMDRIRAKLQEFGWRVLHYESKDKELWGNRGIGAKGYIVGSPPGMDTTRMVSSPKMLKEKELKALEAELSKTMKTVQLEREQRKELEYYLSQVESQLEAYKEKFEVIGGTTYTVEKNDSLWKIAKGAYGDPYKWPVIYRANKDKISNPNLIYPGQELQIPQIKVKR